MIAYLYYSMMLEKTQLEIKVILCRIGAYLYKMRTFKTLCDKTISFMAGIIIIP